MKPHNSSCRLRMESLEDRLVPAVFQVTTTLDTVNAADQMMSLREAVARANATPGTDTIVLPAGVCKITRAGADDNNVRGDFDVWDSLVLRGSRTGASIIDAQQKDRAFELIGRIGVTFSGVTIQNGTTTGNGGAVQALSANVSLTNCLVTGNRAARGGGINLEAGTLMVTGSTVGRNSATGDGGGIRVAGTVTAADSVIRTNVTHGSGGGLFAMRLTMTNCTVSGNTGRGQHSLSQGGGIYVESVGHLSRCVISGNSAYDGGGIYSPGAVTLTGCSVSGNFAGEASGGIGSETVTLTNCTVSGNSAAQGGGGIAGTTVSLTNSTISGNSAGTSGGGIATLNLNLLNVTVTENRAHFGGGIFLVPGGTTAIRNTIIARNSVDSTGAGPDVSGEFSSEGHNLIGDGTGSTGFTDGVNSDIVGTTTGPIDPKLAPLANNGGRTKTHALLASSPAIDHGDNANLLATDQRGAGFVRVKDGDGNGVALADIGAFER